jgi:hypothetical protein
MNNSDLIAIQDLEYEESLQADREKEEKKDLERKKREKIEENIMIKKEKLLVSREGEIINIKFQLPEKNIIYFFTSNDLLSDLYDFIYIQDLGEKFKIYTSHPKKLLNNDKSTLKENNISDRSKMHVYFDN